MRLSAAVSRGIVLLFLCCVSAGAAAVEAPLRVTASIHLTALAERIAKLHAQVGQGVLAERSRRALGDTVREFDAALKDAAARANGPELRDNYALLALLWIDYRDWALRTPTRDNARKLRARTEEVAWIAAKGARLAQEGARGATNASAVRAAQAAVLAQRIAKAHLWMRWDIRDDALVQELRESHENLRRALETLRKSPGETEEVAAHLQAVESQMSFMDEAAQALERREPGTRSIENIAKTGDHIYESMERLARLYEAP